VGPAAQVSGVSGAGQCTQRCRSDFALLTCARNRHSGPFSGAGPHHQIGPAPSTPPTCAIHRTHLRHPLHPPAPSTAPTDLVHSRAHPPLAQCAGPYSPISAAARNHVRRLPAHGTATSQYAARWLAETLSGSVKGPKRVPLSFRNLLPRADVVLPEDAANVFFAELQTGRHETRTAVQSGRKSAQKSVEKYFFLYDRLKQHEKTCETTLLFNRTLFLPSVVFRFAAAIWPLQTCCKPLFRGAQHHITLKLFAYEHLVANHHRRRWKSPVLQ